MKLTALDAAELLRQAAQAADKNRAALIVYLDDGIVSKRWRASFTWPGALLVVESDTGRPLVRSKPGRPAVVDAYGADLPFSLRGPQ